MAELRFIQDFPAKGVKFIDISPKLTDKDDFKNQFTNKVAPLSVGKSATSENEIEAITGATITSVAITDAVNAAANYVDNHKMEWGNM